MISGFDTALHTLLRSDGTLTAMLAGTTAIYSKMAPPTATLDYVVFDADEVEPDDANPFAPDVRVSIMAVSATSITKASQIDARVKALLHGQKLTISGYSVWWQRRTRAISYAENTPSGSVFWHAGAEYIVRMEATT